MLVEVTFVDEKGVAPPVDVSRDFLESLTVTVVDRGSWKGHLVLFDRTGDFILDLISAVGGGRVIQLRWGWDDGRGIEAYPMYLAKWTELQSEFLPEGVRLSFDLLATTAFDQVVDRRPRRFIAGAQISAIVRHIARERGWKTEDHHGNPTIQKTFTSKLTSPLSQNTRETDFKFILEHLLPRAAPVDGKGGPFRFFLDHLGAVHFHQKGFLRDNGMVRYFFGQDNMGSVIEFSTEDLKFVGVLLGAGDTVYLGVDSLTGKSLRLIATNAGGLLDASGRSILRERVEPGEENVTTVLSREQAGRPGGVVSATVGIVARTEADFIQQVKAKYTTVRHQSYKATLVVRGTHAVLPGYNVRVEYLTAGKQVSHFLSGTFFVGGVEHEVGGGGWQTRMELSRLGVGQTDGTVKIENADQAPAAAFKSEDDGPDVRNRTGATETLPVRVGGTVRAVPTSAPQP